MDDYQITEIDVVSIALDNATSAMMLAAKADGKAKMAAKLQMKPMLIQRKVCELLLIIIQMCGSVCHETLLTLFTLLTL